MMHDLLLVSWIFLPAGVANMAPVFAAMIPAIRHLDAPMDGGKSFRGKRILGDHKTWRGIIAGVLAATLVLWLQQLLTLNIPALYNLTAGFDYVNLPTLLVGPLFGLGALGGDAIKSFFKRRTGVHPGGTWFPFDQLDYILGGALAISPFLRFTITQYVLLIIVWGLGVVITTYIGWLLRIRDQPI